MNGTCLFRLIAIFWITLLPGAVLSWADPGIAAGDLGALAALIVMSVVGLVHFTLQRALHRPRPPADAGLMTG
ncbi:MAG: hypothetical protein D6754_10575 [Alphaproteobacteria bacterium]|nr:MAG: hypothetical protein D6754_10575 [Alphaproteobacteria bacterium]